MIGPGRRRRARLIFAYVGPFVLFTEKIYLYL